MSTRVNGWKNATQFVCNLCRICHDGTMEIKDRRYVVKKFTCSLADFLTDLKERGLSTVIRETLDSNSHF